MSRRVVGVFGGSFNPPHTAHVLAATHVLARGYVDHVLVVPTFLHPLGKVLAPYNDRVAMCELAMAGLPRTTISRVEETLGGASRTLRTIEHLRRAHRDWSLRFIMGADLIVESSKWFGFERVMQLAPPLVLGRAGVTYDGSPEPFLPSISSTEVRAQIAAARWADLADLMPREVLAYVRAHGLYAAPELPDSQP